MWLCSVFRTTGDKPPHGATGPKACANASRQQGHVPQPPTPPPPPPPEPPPTLACLTAAGTDATWLGPAPSPSEPSGRINPSQAAAAVVTSARTCPKLQSVLVQTEQLHHFAVPCFPCSLCHMERKDLGSFRGWRKRSFFFLLFFSVSEAFGSGPGCGSEPLQRPGPR